MKLKEKLDAIQVERSSLWQDNLGHGFAGYSNEERADELLKQRAELCDSVAGKAYYIAMENCHKQVKLWVEAVKEAKAAETKAVELQNGCDVLKHTRDLLGSIEV